MSSQDISSSFPPGKKKSIVTVKKSNVWEKNSTTSISPPNYSYPIKPRDRNLMSFSEYTNKDERQGFSEDERIPERIEGIYIYDYNIFLIHGILQKKFDQDKKNNIILLKNKLEIENKKISGRQNLIERKSSRKKIEKYEEQIEKYENDVDKNKYMNKSKILLDTYSELGTINNVVSFVSNNKDNEITAPEDDEKQSMRHKTIFDYLELARKYIKIDLVRKLPCAKCCTGCGANYDEIELIEDESGATICSVCNIEKINVVKNPVFSDSSRVNNSRNNYEDRANFEKVLMRYQGKQPTKPGKELYKKLNEYFISKGLPSSEEYLSYPLLSNGTKKGTSRELLFEALGNINCSGYYDDINLIANVFWGWSLPDVSHLEEIIMEDYDRFQRIYEQLPDREGRKSSLNSQWKLYILLKRKGWKCKSRDFKIPTTPNILEYHKIKTKQIFSLLEWEYNI